MCRRAKELVENSLSMGTVSPKHPSKIRMCSKWMCFVLNREINMCTPMTACLARSLAFARAFLRVNIRFFHKDSYSTYSYRL